VDRPRKKEEVNIVNFVDRFWGRIEDNAAMTGVIVSSVYTGWLT
jgi:hypothetical protein